MLEQIWIIYLCSIAYQELAVLYKTKRKILHSMLINLSKKKNIYVAVLILNRACLSWAFNKFTFQTTMGNFC